MISFTNPRNLLHNKLNNQGSMFFIEIKNISERWSPPLLKLSVHIRNCVNTENNQKVNYYIGELSPLNSSSIFPSL